MKVILERMAAHEGEEDKLHAIVDYMEEISPNRIENEH
jgi:hypothetical protein